MHSLSESDIAAVQVELSAGKQPTVWFTPTAVGVQAGASAKVVSFGDVTEGEFIKVRPTGSRDTMFCSASELTRTRPPRRRKTQPEEPEPPVVAKQPVAPPPSPVARAAALAATKGAAGSAADSLSTAPAPPTPSVRRSTDRRQQAAEVTVTLSASAEGDWIVEVVVGKKRTVRPLPVQPAEVAAAARALPDPVTEAIESSLTAARKRQVERVEQLRIELEAAQRTLRELGG